MNRRNFLACWSLAMWPAVWLPSAWGRGALARTPSQTEGPYYPVVAIPFRESLILDQEAVDGTPMWLSGRVLDMSGHPVTDCRVEIWQCDGAGIYHHPRQPGRAQVDRHFAGFGAMLTDSQGHYRFHTLYPVPYTGRPPHIHVKIWQGGRELLTTQLYLQGQTGNEWWARNREALQIDPLPHSDGLAANFDFVV
ncbi:protocatechuate 3,4-dioxygenase [Photobacterium sp. MCCC 1A19761]|uniref:protocatechuate 3,4-dioxygenase n=1 Tax=Photobacterium sp. MCCC 1A19761 TaxID=3115000 RepID=UPI00307CF4B4